MNFRAVLVALALGVASANRDFRPTARVQLGHKNIGSGLSADGLSTDVQLESEMSDDLRVGLNVDRDSGNGIRSIFAKISQKIGGGDVDADLSMDMGSNAIQGEVTYNRDQNKVVAQVNSASDNVVESVELTNGNFKGRYNMATQQCNGEMRMDLDADTNMLVKLSQNEDTELEINHKLNSDTDVQVSMQPGADNMGATVEVTRRLNADDTVTPKFDLNSKRLTCAWVRKLDAGRTATVNVDPDNSVEIELESENNNDWSGKISAPWNSPSDADITVSRQFNF